METPLKCSHELAGKSEKCPTALRHVSSSHQQGLLGMGWAGVGGGCCGHRGVPGGAELCSSRCGPHDSSSHITWQALRKESSQTPQRPAEPQLHLRKVSRAPARLSCFGWTLLRWLLLSASKWALQTKPRTHTRCHVASATPAENWNLPTARPTERASQETLTI